MMYFKFYRVRIKSIIIEKYLLFYYKFASSHLGKIEHHKTRVRTKPFTRKKPLCLIDPDCTAIFFYIKKYTFTVYPSSRYLLPLSHKA